ncbi:bone morphogenetic protein 10 [Electrophorus electricus]|uniref:TGF-beta family profile domain-containing protein n=1 Tax=Electrophorus electricus TaxID=8005 RepID=A0A4W4HP99_ELEEL|nr:bone morphogenetic protein 10 [Electrophorus electricus]
MAGTGVWKYWLIATTSCLPLILLLLGPYSGDSSPIGSLERQRPAPGRDDGHGELVDPSFLEQNSEVDMQNLLETLRGQFLRTFNLSGPGSALMPGVPRVEPPEYMLELYNRFAHDRTTMPSANIVRSFKNEDSSPRKMGDDGVRRHALLFNVSIPHHEQVVTAELRLYTLVQTDRHLYAGVDRKVTVYEAVPRDANSSQLETSIEEDTQLTVLASRQVYCTDSGWESFDMTAAVHNWRMSDASTTHRLEVHIASLNVEDIAGLNKTEFESPTTDGDMEIDTSPEDRHKPLMIVFSNDQSVDHRGDQQELNEMINHETSGPGLKENLELGTVGDDRQNQDEEPDEEALLQMRSNLIYDTTSRIRRNAKGNQCKKSSLYVDFKDIGWNSWIIEPEGYEAYECTGMCTYPLTKHVTPTKHAIVQTLVSLKSPVKVSRACCVPTKLDPISLLYLDDAGVVTYQYKYEGMVVAECGCR